MGISKRLRQSLGNADDVAALTQEIAKLRRDVHSLTRTIETMRGQLELLPKIVNSQKNDAKWRSIFRSQLAALVRTSYVAARPELTATEAVRARRFRLRSQNEEDGLVLALLDKAGVVNRTFVEIGSGGTGGNSAVLAHELGWGGVMIEGSKRGSAVARELFRHNRNVTVLQKMVTSDNINSLIKQAGIVGEIDFLSLDIDSIDYWLFKALDTKRTVIPRLIVAEYNAHFGPDRAVTLPDAPKPAQAPKSYFGASLAALTKVANVKGYRLILCEDSGVNAFFLRNGLAPELPGLTAASAYRPMRRRVGADEDAPHIEDVYALAAAQDLPIIEV
jgi:hypothetical protein